MRAKQKQNVLRGKALNPNLSDAARYQARLDKLIKQMTTQVEAELKALFKTETAKEYFATDDTLSNQARIVTSLLMEKFNDIFAFWSKPIAEQVVQEANKSSEVSVASSLKELSGGMTLNVKSISPEMLDILQASTTENVALIKSISEKYLNGVQQAVMRSITQSGGLQDLIPYLQKSKEITYRRARMIAYDQTRKAYNSINRGRMERLGIKQFEWLHSGGSNEPRKLHIELSGKIFSLDNPPVIDKKTGQRGFPGDLVNCACRYLPIIKFED
jgi:SPP1 gp7 family putative phage head morphogenesis protein